ncbi:MAG: PHP domain-containing protein [Limnobacter sp.]|nr:PHP domain-containing protein [Limnobacter sp.]
MNADLHCHSVMSDGVLTPEELALRAAAQGVQIWSLTDHDELAGLDRAQLAAEKAGMLFVPGVEISVTWAGKTVHIVGLGIQAHDSALAEGLAQVRSGRNERAQEIGRELEKHGIEGAYQGAVAYATNPALIGRTHFARFLIERGVCSSVRDVFANYLVKGKPGYVPFDWASLREAVGWILDSSGAAVIAHPGRYTFSELQLDELIAQFKQFGGAGLEVVTGSHTTDEYRYFAQKAVRSGLKASRGSDFHSPQESRINLGELPPLPCGCVPIWDNWARLYM